MSKNIYNLRIPCSGEKQLEMVSQLLKIRPNKNLGNIWCLEVEESENDDYFNFINYFLDIMDGKYSDLQSLEILTEEISIWHLYEYTNQCNIEYLPNDLKRLGDCGISLCISCWAS